MTPKEDFAVQLVQLVNELKDRVSTEDGQWTIKGFIDIFRNVYTISPDTKIVPKILEIHLFPHILAFAQANGYKIVLAEHQNYYPDISFVKSDDESVKFAVDLKTTYRNPQKAHLCNGFTLGSHGEYFTNRSSRKNIQFPYSSYSGHFCLGIIYDRADGVTMSVAWRSCCAPETLFSSARTFRKQSKRLLPPIWFIAIRRILIVMLTTTAAGMNRTKPDCSGSCWISRENSFYPPGIIMIFVRMSMSRRCGTISM
jgi:hypothetical protein